ncbi:MAG: M3 family metallopeptidase [Neisseria sp.]|nr:M3 family metallopeptidase [Neisseria sp.]
MTHTNALLNLTDIPAFDALDAAQIAPAMQTVMAEARARIAALKELPETTWDNTVEALTDISERVGRVWGVIAHINSVADTPAWREAYNALIPEVTLFFTEIAQDEALYARFKAIRAADAFGQLSAAQQKKLNNDLRDFVLSGAELPQQEQARFAELQSEGAALAAAFSQNVLDATDAFAVYFDDAAALAGLPESALQMFAAAAEAEGKSGYKIGLQAPHYLAVVQFADNRALREKLYRAYAARASELDDAARDNGANIDRILAIAAEEAQLLGYADYAELSLVTKMADSPQQVLAFLREMAARAKPFAERDLAELTAFARESLGEETLQPWDIAYYSEKLREARYAFSEEEVKQYFPASRVLEGLFALVNDLYGVEFVAEERPLWHPDVRYFSLKKNGAVIGGVYLDLYARGGKKSGAWMNDYCGRRRQVAGSLNGEVQLPLAYLVCNFAPPVEGEAWLSHQEILTLFHETGHGLHHLLTRIDELGVAGINGVEWDAVELPSQFMENFAWEYDVLAAMSRHKQDGSRLPESLFAKMLAAKNFQTGLFIVRQMEFGLFDVSIYSAKTQPCDWRGILQQIRAEVAVVPQIPENRFAQSFSHIFAGGYAAGYYSYIWAEVLSADVYAAFEEENDRAATGERFWQEILSVGGSRSAAESFRAFRGREPQADALLRHLGLSDAVEAA